MGYNHSETLVTDDKRLADICLLFEQKRTIALDTEYSRESTYYPNPALLQISDGDEANLLDVLQIKNLSSVKQVLANPHITKIIHSAKQDIEVLKCLDCSLEAPLFDTQLAAAFLSLGSQISYKNLVQECLGVTLEKGHSRSDWLVRPLSDEQINYAIDDVIYLHELYYKLKARLQKTGKEAWFIEESNQVLNNYHEDHPEKAWRKVSGQGQLESPEELGRLQLLAQWREQKAREANLPRRWLIKDKQLIAVAKQQDTLENLVAEVTLNADQCIVVNSDELKAALAATEHSVLHLRRIPSPQDKRLIEKMKCLISKVAKEHQIEASLIASHKQIASAAMNQNKDAQISWLSGWRLKVLGDNIHNLIEIT